MAPVSAALPKRLDKLLNSPHRTSLRRRNMLDEQIPTTGLQNPPNLV
jgi:hypothetical protein